MEPCAAESWEKHACLLSCISFSTLNTCAKVGICQKNPTHRLTTHVYSYRSSIRILQSCHWLGVLDEHGIYRVNHSKTCLKRVEQL